ncbi:MAG TPA: PilZ domain-containing protein [Candidatus Angelobacter sp.]|nr:PilZ domain-containing protein [Candidatus Angelobacter sp.]
MVHSYKTQRSSPRALAVCPISVTFESCEAHGIVRDISEGGIFFYSSSKPPLHASINFSLRLKDKNISGTGEVVRVEQPAPGSAIGVAIKISSYNEAAV